MRNNSLHSKFLTLIITLAVCFSRYNSVILFQRKKKKKKEKKMKEKNKKQNLFMIENYLAFSFYTLLFSLTITNKIYLFYLFFNLFILFICFIYFRLKTRVIFRFDNWFRNFCLKFSIRAIWCLHCFLKEFKIFCRQYVRFRPERCSI